MSWRRVGKSLQQVAAHTLLFGFTILLVLKLDHIVSCSWWVIFFPIWLFHAVVARGRFSLPAPSVPHGRDWAPCHAVVAVPLLVAFELLLCIYLESTYVNGITAVSLKLVFLPLLVFEVIVLVDNFRMCRALLPGDDESMSDEAVWETLPMMLSLNAGAYLSREVHLADSVLIREMSMYPNERPCLAEGETNFIMDV